MADVLEKLSRRKAVVAVTDSLDPSTLRKLTTTDGTYDPHVWFDVSMWTAAASRIERALSEAEPSLTAVFAERGAAYRKKLMELHDWAKQELGTLPTERRLLVTAHDAFGYFGRAYQVEVVGIQGISTDNEASIQDINHLVDMIVGRKIPAVFVESSVSQRTIQALVEGATGRGHAIRIGGEIYSDALGAAGTPEGTYIGMVRHNVKTIVEALK
jgi:manganese/zinc/iron transport system substrate-binding protein